jgi:hypothetical protein
MADKKISDLNSYTNYKYTGDNLLIVDAENSETKKIDASAFFNNISGDVQCSGIIKSNRINVNQGKLYVDNGAGNEFVKIGAYGTGSFFGTPGSNNGTVYTLGVGGGGKIIESERVTTTAISGSGYLNLNTKPKALINAPGSGKIILPTEVYIMQSYNSGDPANHLTNRTGVGDWSLTNNVNAFVIQSYQSGFSGAQNVFAKYPGDSARKPETFVSYRNVKSTEHDIVGFFNRPVCISATIQNEFTGMNQVPAGMHFIKIKYSILEGNADFRQISNLKIINENILGTGTWTFDATN